MNRRLVRPTQGRMLGGVAAGIADRYGWDRRTVRLAFVASCLLPGPQFVLYVIAWLAVPSEDAPAYAAA